MKKATKLFLLLVFFIFVSCISQHLKSPKKIVAIFDQVYGTSEMSSIASYTTGNFRDAKPKEVWVIDTWKVLKRLEYKRLNSKFIDSKIEGNKAIVVLQTQIHATGGKVDQKEVFYLIKQDGTWKIDELVVTDEELEERKEKI
ncbi:MAG: hypothetical protein AMJ45_05230 [Syntrophobacter sp. DG_60]|nr:MAG: hypothetical protein AMJ45_05230 [Syntrophobacter sp. DG_60]